MVAGDIVSLPAIDQMQELWPELTLAQGREVLDLVIEAVFIKRAKPGTKVFDPGRIEPCRTSVRLRPADWMQSPLPLV